MSQNFLIEHDRHGKIPTRITVYADWQIAEERLFRLDMEQLDELNACLKAGKPVRMEYVVLGVRRWRLSSKPIPATLAGNTKWSSLPKFTIRRLGGSSRIGRRRMRWPSSRGLSPVRCIRSATAQLR